MSFALHRAGWKMAKCGKRCFPSSEAATRAMRKIPAKRGSVVPLRVYRCAKCKAWHFTSGQYR